MPDVAPARPLPPAVDAHEARFQETLAHLDTALELGARGAAIHERIGNLRTLEALTGDDALRARILADRSLTAYQAGDRDRAPVLADRDRAPVLAGEALALCAALGDRHRDAALENNLADLHHAAGRGDAAMEHLKRAVALFAQVGADERTRLPEVWKLVSW